MFSNAVRHNVGMKSQVFGALVLGSFYCRLPVKPSDLGVVDITSGWFGQPVN